MKEERLATLENPNSSFSELYRKIRTNIEYASIDKKIKVLNVTSTNANETKSTTVCNLAVMYATKFERVLLIDTDLRKPSVHTYMKIKNSLGLVDCILDYSNNNYDLSQINLSKYTQKITNDKIVHQFDVMTAGSKISNPAEFLGSNTFKMLLNDLKEHFDMIIIDSAPSGIIVDGIIVSAACDATLFVIEHNRNLVESTKNVITQLKNAGANVIGSLLTKVPSRKNNNYSYGYNEYSYFHNNEKDGVSHE